MTAASGARAALTGGSFVLPFLVLNAIVGNRVEPFFSLIRPGIHASAQEYVLLFTTLLLLPAGALVALLPVRGGRAPLAPNVGVAAALLLVFAVLAFALGEEIYRCDVLRIPNCD